MATRGIEVKDARGRPMNLGRAVKFDDTQPGIQREDEFTGETYLGHADKRTNDAGVRPHEMSHGNRRLTDLIKNSSAKAPAFVVDRDGAQRMANSLSFFVREVTLGQARDNGMWIVAVDTGSDSTNFLPSSAMKDIKAAAVEGLEVPRRRWTHNALRAGN